jgi:hypothetical protein
MNLLADLDRHISRALELGNGIRLEADQVDLLVARGRLCRVSFGSRGGT